MNTALIFEWFYPGCLVHASDLVADAETAAAELTTTPPPFVLDVRTQREWQERHIEPSINIPLNRLQARLDELPSHRRIVVVCAGGFDRRLPSASFSATGSQISQSSPAE
jgi:rhodanese-related sulfurtransferase